MRRSGIAGSYGKTLVLIGNADLTSKAAGCAVLHLPAASASSCGSSPLSAFGVLRVLNLSYCNKCGVSRFVFLWCHKMLRIFL